MDTTQESVAHGAGQVSLAVGLQEATNIDTTRKKNTFFIWFWFLVKNSGGGGIRTPVFESEQQTFYL